jgi:S-adenosylmethionine:tRNA ribosyltransferase-isomerase
MLMAVAAFGGFDKVKEAYQVALDYRDEEGGAYRFGPYGDAMLIL